MAVLSAVVFVAAAVWLISRPVDVPDVGTGPLLLAAAGCMLLYLASHVLRAIRLAIIGLSVHRTSFRTLALLHLAVAPWSMIAPFKLDELIRMNELRSINNSLPRAAMTVIIDRSMDGPALLVVTLYLAAKGKADIALYTGLIGLTLAAVTISFFAASHILQLVQRYIFVYHYKPRALRMLRIVHNLRILARLGRETILDAAPILILCTIGIWFFEIVAVALILHVATPAQADLQSVVSATVIRANSGWRALLLGEQLGFPAALITKIFVTGLLLIWPPAIWLYCKRRYSEVDQAHFVNREWNANTARRRA